MVFTLTRPNGEKIELIRKAPTLNKFKNVEVLKEKSEIFESAPKSSKKPTIIYILSKKIPKKCILSSNDGGPRTLVECLDGQPEHKKLQPEEDRIDKLIVEEKDSSKPNMRLDEKPTAKLMNSQEVENFLKSTEADAGTDPEKDLDYNRFSIDGNRKNLIDDGGLIKITPKIHKTNIVRNSPEMLKKLMRIIAKGCIVTLDLDTGREMLQCLNKNPPPPPYIAGNPKVKLMKPQQIIEELVITPEMKRFMLAYERQKQQKWKRDEQSLLNE